MSRAEAEPLQSWLELLCRMLPGASEAILLTGSGADCERVCSWPQAGAGGDELIAAARLAAGRNETVTTTLSRGQGEDRPTDTIMALPLISPGEFTGTLAVRLRIKPSQQPVVTQVLAWGEGWLELLLRTRSGESGATRARSRSGTGLPGNRAGLVVLAVLLIGGLMSLVTGPYRVTAAATLEGKTQRVVVAPFDGFIASAYARAGDTVTAGELIAELETHELLLEQQRYAAEMNEYTRQYRQALAAREQTQAHIFKSQVRQAEAQLGLLETKIRRAALKSTLDGVIVSGDLSRSLGAPVATGEILFEVAPLDEYRLIVSVDEKQVADVRPGLRGSLTLKSLSGSELPFTVHRVSPMFEPQADGIAYRVEAHLLENHPALRPGMQGIAKIEVDRRSYLWIYLHELADLIRLWAWRWLP